MHFSLKVLYLPGNVADEMFQVQTFPGINAESFILFFFVICLQAFASCTRRLASLFMASYSTFFLLYDNQMS